MSLKRNSSPALIFALSIILSLTFSCGTGGDGVNGENGEKPSAPQNLTAELSPNKGYLILSWEGSSDAENYLVERKSEDDSDFSVVCGASHPDTDCPDYVPTRDPRYRVCARSSSGYKSEYSDTVYVNTYDSASFYIYACANFGDGCASACFDLGGVYRPIAGLIPGSWYNTGFEIIPGRSYAIASCQGCPGNCGSPISFETPDEAFFSHHYCPGIYFYCGTPCDAPNTCPD